MQISENPKHATIHTISNVVPRLQLAPHGCQVLTQFPTAGQGLALAIRCLPPANGGVKELNCPSISRIDRVDSSKPSTRTPSMTARDEEAGAWFCQVAIHCSMVIRLR